MSRFGVLVVLVLACVLLQDAFAGSWFWRRRRRRSNNCRYPIPSQVDTAATTNDYFYGTTSLWGKKRDMDHKWTLKHSLILFRGQVFEWGIDKSYSMARTPASCKVSWHWHGEGSSRCSLDDIQSWTRDYEQEYGSYTLLGNNCHFFSHRLKSKLDTNCGR